MPINEFIWRLLLNDDAVLSTFICGKWGRGGARNAPKFLSVAV